MNTTGVTSGEGTAYPFGASVFTSGFSGVRVNRSLVLCVFFVDRYLSFFWPLCCLFFFDLWILVTSLVSSNSSYMQRNDDDGICFLLALNQQSACRYVAACGHRILISSQTVLNVAL
jgi:hypothetical protein